MIKPIITNKETLAIPSKKIYSYELAAEIIKDLIDTAEHHSKKSPGCVGLAANQIGYLQRIVIIKFGANWLPMINPEMIPEPNGKTCLANEGCLSRPSVNVKIRRAKRIAVMFWDESEDLIKQKFRNFDARVIAHEVDHLDGIFI